ncbi:Uncharacterised protein [Turicibacter sanguinis]|nr:Uncharacterised protein [Turicibacter sanguinis]
MSKKQITSLPVLELGVDRIECPSCGWGYRKEHGKVLVGGTYTHDCRS